MNTTIEEADNIVPNLRKQYFDAANRGFISDIRAHADDVCRYKIPVQYIRYAFNHFKGGICYFNEINEIMGFAIWKVIKNTMSKSTLNVSKMMYVYLICAPATSYKFGNILFPDLDTYCYDNNINTIQLEAQNPDLIPYYNRYGFVQIPTINKPYLMEKPVIIQAIMRRRGNRTRRHRHTTHTYDDNI